MGTSEHTPPAQAGCPIDQMTFGEVVRYLQEGYEPPVQRAITAHVRYCNACAAEVERVRALQAMGGHLMEAHLAAEETAEHLPPARLAAFVDGTLPETERAEVAAHLAACHACYRQYAAVERELATPVPAARRAPKAALRQVLWPKDRAPRLPASADLGARLHTGWRRLTRWSEQMLGGPFRAPVLALALATIALMVLLPRLRASNVISLEAVQQAIANPDQVMSGTLPGVTLRNDILVITDAADDEIVFVWPPVEDRPVAAYRVGLYDSNNRLLHEQEVTDHRWRVSTSTFVPGALYTLNVVAFYEGGGVRPVIRGQKIQRAG